MMWRSHRRLRRVIRFVCALHVFVAQLCFAESRPGPTAHAARPMPPPPPDAVQESWRLNAAAGAGFLSLHDNLGRDGEPAVSLSFALGRCVAPNWALRFAYHGAFASRGEAAFSQSMLGLGVQRYLWSRFRLQADVGPAWVSQHLVGGNLTEGPGLAVALSAGFDWLRVPGFAVAIELFLARAHYTRENWEMGGLQLSVALR